MKRINRFEWILGFWLAVALGPGVAVADLVFDEDEAQLLDRLGAREEAEDEARFEDATEDGSDDVADSADILAAEDEGLSVEDPTGASISALPRATQKLLKPVKRVPTKAELLRRERLRQELKNEEMIQTKLEENRLRGELTRTNRISKVKLLEDKKAAEPKAEAPTAIEVEVVSDQLATSQAASVAAPAAAAARPAPVSYPSTTNTASRSSWSLDGLDDQALYVSVRPLLGAAGMVQTGSFVSAQPNFGAGVGIEVGVNDWFAMGAGYRYSRIGLNNGFNYDFAVSQAQQFVAAQTRMQYQMHRATVDGKVFFLSRRWRIRPFVGAGLGYQRGILNYDEAYRGLLQNTFFFTGNQFEPLNLDQFLGTAQAGFDIQITRNIGMTVMFDYAYAFATNVQANALGFNQIGFNNLTADAEKRATAQQLQNVGFWNLSAGATFSF